MRVNTVSLNFRGAATVAKSSAAKKTVNFWAENKSESIDYAKDLQILLNQTLYSGRIGIGEHSPSGYGDVSRCFNIKSLVCLTGESAVFNLNNGNILKLSVHPYPQNIPQFHAPELLRGTINTPGKYEIFNLLRKMDTDTFYYVIQERGKTPVTHEDYNALINKVKASGYDVCDIKNDQFAYFDIDGKKEARFIDLGCIVPKGHGGW